MERGDVFWHNYLFLEKNVLFAHQHIAANTEKWLLVSKINIPVKSSLYDLSSTFPLSKEHTNH